MIRSLVEVSAIQSVRIASFLVSFVALVGCTQTPQPGRITGPIAYLNETNSAITKHSENNFYVSAVNGNDYTSDTVDTGTTRDFADEGSGTVVSMAIVIPTTSTRFSLVGHSVFAAPVFCLADPDYYISGDVTFTPIANHIYFERGLFEPDYSAVWIEDENTKKIEGKVEVHGSTAIPLAHKVFINGCPGGNNMY